MYKRISINKMAQFQSNAVEVFCKAKALTYEMERGNMLESDNDVLKKMLQYLVDMAESMMLGQQDRVNGYIEIWQEIFDAMGEKYYWFWKEEERVWRFENPDSAGNEDE